MEANDNKPYCIFRHGRKSHTWGELRQAAQHTVRDPSVSWLGENIDPTRTHLNETLVGSGDVVADVKARLDAVGLEPKAGQVVARELLLSASSSYFAANGHTGRHGNFDPDKLAVWRDTSLQFLRDEFGDNLVTACLHLDETAPHIHAWIAMSAHVEKKGRGRPRKDGTKADSTVGWTMNHDKVVGSGKAAFTTRQDRYAQAMQALGLRRGQRHSAAHHEPIREYYARLDDLKSKAEIERQAARDLRLDAEQNAIREAIRRQATDYAAEQARQAERDAQMSRRQAVLSRTAAEESRLRATQAEQERLSLLAAVRGERDSIESMKGQVREFLERRGMAKDFDAWYADMLAVAKLRQNNGEEWTAYQNGLKAYAADLRQYGEWRDAMSRRGDRHLRYLFEAGARALGHVSVLLNPSRLVVDGVNAWLRLEGGDTLIQRHRTVISWLRETWAVLADAAIEPPQRDRGREM